MPSLLWPLPIFLPFYTVHGILKARMMKQFAIPNSSAPHFVRTFYHDLSSWVVLTAWLMASLSDTRLWPMGSFWSVFCNCGFHSICSLISSLFSHVQLFATPWTAACQASLYFTISRSLLKLISIESVMPSNHLILCHPLLLLLSIFSSIRIFSNESVLHIRYEMWSIRVSASASVLPMTIQDWFPLRWTGLIQKS